MAVAYNATNAKNSNKCIVNNKNIDACNKNKNMQSACDPKGQNVVIHVKMQTCKCEKHTKTCKKYRAGHHPPYWPPSYHHFFCTPPLAP